MRAELVAETYKENEYTVYRW